MPPAERVLLVGLSARALAASARAAGFVPVVLDAFADLDTRATAAGWRRVPIDSDWRFEPGPLLEAASALAPPPVPLVWGSGFERAPGVLRALARGRELLGSGPEAVGRTKDPLLFAETCRALSVPHPETRLEPPADRGLWLIKRRGGAGGGHVRAFVPGQPLPPGHYLQRVVAGRPVSALIVAGRRGRCLAFTGQWHEPSRRNCFRFAGVVAPASLCDGLRESLEKAALAVASAFGLAGLASADFLVAPDGGWHLLEINPRPGAALEAVELAHGLPLFGRHVAVCRGQEVAGLPEPRGAAATLVVYAPRGVRVPARFAWPGWTGDRTPGPARVPAGAPLCTVRATGRDAAGARAEVERRRRVVLDLLGAGESGTLTRTRAAG